MSQTSMQQELILALEYRKLLSQNLAQHKSVYALIEKELIDILYAKNIQQLEIAQKNIEFLLQQYIQLNNPKYNELDNTLNHLITQRKVYLMPPPKTFMSFWSEESWTGFNFLILSVPFVVSFFVPLIGPLALGYATLDAVLAGIDMGRAHRTYWSEENPPETRILNTEQIKHLKKNYQDIDPFLPENNPDPNLLMKQSITNASYWTYALVFAIGIIGLAALLFPPIGIPELALLCLAAVAAGGTGLQFGFIYQKQQMQAQDIQNSLTQSEQLIVTHQHSVSKTSNLSSSEKYIYKKNKERPKVTPPALSTPTKPEASTSTKKEEDDDNDTRGFHP